MIIYVASPYTHDDPLVVDQRFMAVRDYVTTQLRAGALYFSPIVYTHELAKAASLPGDAAFWFEFNFRMLKVCDKVIILKLQGWEKSIGVASEIAYAKTHGKPLEYVKSEYDF
jgi:hypothetical protein